MAVIISQAVMDFLTQKQTDLQNKLADANNDLTAAQAKRNNLQAQLTSLNNIIGDVVVGTP